MPVLNFSKPSGMPSDLWGMFHNQVLMPYVSRHALRLRGGMSQADVEYLTSALNEMTGGMSGLNAEGEIFGPPSPQPVQQKPWYESLVTSVMSAVPKVADSLVQLKLGQQAIKAGVPAAPALPVISSFAEETPWMTYMLIGGVLLGGFFLARRYKYI